MLFASLQPELAEAKGVSLRLYGVLFLAIVALTTAECAQIVGVLLVFALMVGPAAAAQRLTRSVAAGVLVAALLALGEAWLGITLAFYTDWPSSFWITALSVAAYLLAVGFSAAPEPAVHLISAVRPSFRSARGGPYIATAPHDIEAVGAARLRAIHCNLQLRSALGCLVPKIAAFHRQGRDSKGA